MRIGFIISIMMLFFGCPTINQISDEYYTDLYNFDQTGKLGRGINMGNFLESPLSEGGEGAWVGGTTIQQAFFVTIADAGFKHVRIPIRWSDYADPDPAYTITQTFKDRVKVIVDWAIAEGLLVVINVHHYVEMMDPANNTLAYHKARLHEIWDQITDLFPIGTYPASVLYFEPLNEPNTRVTYTEWNNIIEDITNLVWATKNQPERKIVIGTANWGGVPGLYELDLPASANSANTIITYHYYEPFHFTHQGAEWVSGAGAWIGTRWTGTSFQQREVTDHFDSVVAWNQANGNFELWMGEFGAYSKYVEETDQRAWTAFCSREAEKRGISWAYWEFCSGFGAYDFQAAAWRDHLLNGPLIPVN